MNRIQEFGKEKGIPSANKFWQITQLSRATAFRLWRDRSIYPDRATVETICKKLKAQPGDFLIYMDDDDTIASPAQTELDDSTQQTSTKGSKRNRSQKVSAA